MKKLFVLALIMVASVSLYAQTVPQGGQYDYRPECQWYGREQTQCDQDWYLYVYYPLLCQELCEGDICLGLFPSTGYSVQFTEPICCNFHITGEAGWWYDATMTSTDAGADVTIYFDWTFGNSLALANTFVASFVDGGGAGAFQFQLPGAPNPAEQYHKICATGVDVAAGAHGYYQTTTTLTAIYSL